MPDRKAALQDTANTANKRRTLLKTGLMLSLGGTGLLTACGGGGDDPTDQAALDSVPLTPAPTAPIPVPAPPVEGVTTKPVEQNVVRFARILNLQTPTYQPPSNQREADEDIQTYVTRALNAKFDLLKNTLTQGLEAKTESSDITYFVVPEFYWNVHWDAVKNEAELKAFSALCVTQVQQHVRNLIALFPREKFGKLALLPGTTQVVKKQLDDAAPPAPASGVASAIKDKDLPAYEALNYVLVIDNFSKSNPDGSRPISIWPKRNVSGIDFDTYKRTTVSKGLRQYWKVNLGAFSILVLQKSGTTAAYYAQGKRFTGFDNDPLGGVPFGIDVCLDYALAYTDNEYLRMGQIEDTNYILDFLIACGMNWNPKHKYLPSVQYVIRNDGMGNGQCEIYALGSPASRNGISAREKTIKIDQKAIVALDSSILYDSRIEIHPLWQDPVQRPVPTEPLPSPIEPPRA
ncbi:hypothetical protein [Ralstonia sp. UBA689]|uniref:hypothetical protein n=1 Tax=Ralstonia sp. UBA689 TaxID=1947373 RepID=UPI0025E6E1A2|nr:hypothetical protein [Ralstonia sp. UBA689]